VEGKGRRESIEHLVVNTQLRRLYVACVLKGSHRFIYTLCVYLLTEWNIPAFSFTATKSSSLSHTLWVPIQTQWASVTPYWTPWSFY